MRSGPACVVSSLCGGGVSAPTTQLVVVYVWMVRSGMMFHPSQLLRLSPRQLMSCLPVVPLGTPWTMYCSVGTMCALACGPS